MNNQVVDLMSLFNAKANEIVVPSGTSASYDSSKGPCIIAGKLENHGTITITGQGKGTQVLVAAEIINTGSIICNVETLSISAAGINNTGEIEAANSLKITSTRSKLPVSGEAGTMSAADKIIFAGQFGITIDGGNFKSAVLQFDAPNGAVVVTADSLEGDIQMSALTSRIKSKAGRASLAGKRLLTATHVYYSTTDLSLGAVSHPGDAVVLLSGGQITADSITAGSLVVGCGVNFSISGGYPNPTSDSDVDVPWAITGAGYQPFSVAGAINVTGNAQILCWTTEVGADFTVAGNLDLATSSGYGTVTIAGDVEVGGELTIDAYQVTFNGDSLTVTGDLTIGNTSKSSNVTLPGSVFTASGNVTFNGYLITFTGETFTMDGDDKDLITSAAMKIDASSAINIKADVSTTLACNLLFFSDGNVATGSITVDNSVGTFAGSVAIKAHRTGGNAEFVIGGTDASNGVNGTIKTDTVNGGATDDTNFSHGCVYITNGGTGGIKITNATDISVKGTNSKSGGITLNANDGKIKLPTGTLSADGTGSAAGSFIQLLADSIETVDGTVISASDNGSSSKQKTIQLVTSKIVVAGSNGLEVRANGGGNEANVSSVAVWPKGAITFADNDSPAYFLYWYSLNSAAYQGAGEINFDGSGSAKLKLSCNGSNSILQISGYPVEFNTGDTTLECKGGTNHQINIGRYLASGSDGLQFNGGDVTIDASGQSSGDGGIIMVSIDRAYRSNTGKVTMKADGNGTGKGGQITFQPGATDLVFGTDDEQFSFSAKGGSTSGDGGKIDIQGWSSSIEVNGATNTTSVLDVSVPGSDGTGGEIDIVAYGASGLTFDASNPSYLKADGGSSGGDGGKITITTSNVPLTIGAGNSAVSLSAAAKGGDGAGGTLDVTSWYGITADTLNIDVSAHGEGDGGAIKLNAGYSMFTLNGGELNTDGGEDGGKGGLIHLEGGSITLPAEENTLLSANGIAGGVGGAIEIVTQWASVDIGSDNNQIQLQANGSAAPTARARRSLLNGFGDGGHIFTWQSEAYTVQAGAGLAVIAYDSGKGGNIDLNCTESVTVNGPMNADGTSTGDGGSISIEAPTLILGEGAIFSAEGGVSGGKGGSIEIKNGDASVALTFSAEHRIFLAKGYGSAEGGYVSIDKVGKFDVHKVISVDGGDGVTPTNKFGSIRLNGLLCQQWKAYSDWPKTYWKGVDQGTADGTIAGYAHALSDTIRGYFDPRVIGTSDEHAVHIYYMNKAADFDTYFATSSASGQELGLSLPLIGVTAVFKNIGTVLVETSTGVPTIKENTTVHELGHQYDYLLGALSQQPNTDPDSFATSLEGDYSATFDVPSCSVVLPTYPCSTFTGKNSEKLEEWLATGQSAARKRLEVFTHLFAYVIVPNTNYPELEAALSHLPDTKKWMQDQIAL